jgi:hypothetical protein
MVIESFADGFEIVEGFLFYVLEPDYNIGDLHSGVVDVVLDFDLFARRSKKPDWSCRRAPSFEGARCEPPCLDSPKYVRR